MPAQRVLKLTEATVARIRQGQSIPEGFPGWLIRFIREFADGCHHHKEEDVLFPLLEQRGIPRESGPIGCMLQEHELGRALVRRMQAAICESPPNNELLADAAAEYIVLLRQHIFKENNVLFRMAEQCLTAADDENTVRRYRDLEPTGGTAICHRCYSTEVANWEEEFKKLRGAEASPPSPRVTVQAAT
jgi:hemerythrin-like domain-containing protein